MSTQKHIETMNRIFATGKKQKKVSKKDLCKTVAVVTLIAASCGAAAVFIIATAPCIPLYASAGIIGGACMGCADGAYRSRGAGKDFADCDKKKKKSKSVFNPLKTRRVKKGSFSKEEAMILLKHAANLITLIMNNEENPREQVQTFILNFVEEPLQFVLESHPHCTVNTPQRFVEFMSTYMYS
jgi:hypothetical protein